MSTDNANETRPEPKAEATNPLPGPDTTVQIDRNDSTTTQVQIDAPPPLVGDRERVERAIHKSLYPNQTWESGAGVFIARHAADAALSVLDEGEARVEGDRAIWLEISRVVNEMAELLVDGKGIDGSDQRGFVNRILAALDVTEPGRREPSKRAINAAFQARYGREPDSTTSIPPDMFTLAEIKRELEAAYPIDFPAGGETEPGQVTVGMTPREARNLADAALGDDHDPELLDATVKRIGDEADAALDGEESQ